MTAEEQFRKAVLAGDHAGAAAWLRDMPHALTLEDACRLREVLAWALKITHAAKAGHSGKLAIVLRSSAYREPRARAMSTFSVKG